MPSTFAEKEIRTYYETLYRAWGAQHWWPAETPFEVIVGAYLTQNTAWINVERALANLRNAGALSVDASALAVVSRYFSCGRRRCDYVIANQRDDRARHGVGRRRRRN